jgi:hypothetical protein
MQRERVACEGRSSPDFRHYFPADFAVDNVAQLSWPLRQLRDRGESRMKPKDRKFPTVDEYYQLQLREVASESYPQRRWNRSGVDRQFGFRAGVVGPVHDLLVKSTTTRH